MKTLLLFLFLCPLLANAQQDSLKAMAVLSDQFMEFVKLEKYPEAFESLKPHWPLEEANFKALVDSTVTQMNAHKKTFGAVTGTEFIRAEKIGNSFLRLTYLQKFEKSAFRWRITFYNSSDKWLVNAVSWDHSLDPLFE